MLRQQLIILQRQAKRPKLTWRDRSLIVLLASKLRTWKEALIIVQPDTVLRSLLRGIVSCFAGYGGASRNPSTSKADHR
ncbi:MAG: hypothetical protein U9R15_09480 [Chloroflexota bacterium]|nr:hypothetical protein [Chloroflexota bacterium]